MTQTEYIEDKQNSNKKVNIIIAPKVKKIVTTPP